MYKKHTKLEKVFLRMFPNTILQIVLQRSGIMEGLAKRVGITMAEIKKCKLKLHPPEVLIKLGRDEIDQWDQFDSADDGEIERLITYGREAATLQKGRVAGVLGR